MAKRAALKVLSERTDLAEYGDNSIILFALELAAGVDDIHSVAATALTDCSNDKSCDLLWVDPSSGRAVMAQGYMSTRSRPAAPAGKAASLHQAVGWILGRKSDGIPSQLLSAASELWAALDADEIYSIELWYCHNLAESDNVRHEMTSTVNSAKALLSQHWPRVEIEVSGREIGERQLDEMFEASQLDIAVSDTVEFAVPGAFLESGEDWDALCTTIRGSDIHDLYNTHGSRLFALNVRDYLGLIRSDKNINNNMRESALNQPSRFFAYNNGLTILTGEWELGSRRHGQQKLRIEGIAIVNGAQTTGVLGNIDDGDASPLGNVRVLARFVKSNDRSVLEKIIEYNNSQNRVEAADFRSNDEVQERLRREFSSVPDADYRGGRRGGARDVIERPANLISTKTAAQALACFHGSPDAAYHEIGRIWSDNDYYLRTFDPRVTARHVVFSYSLLKAIEFRKSRLGDKSERTSKENATLEFLRLRGGGFMLASAIASNLDTICGTPFASSWGLRFKQNCSPVDATAEWEQVAGSLSAFCSMLEVALLPNFRSAPRQEQARQAFTDQLSAFMALNPMAFSDFAARIECAAVQEH